ncbi:N-acetyl-gamma-glutamyl-phosphate reductase [Bradyrhizobium sp. U87765 SZCCT0131]|uniref:N-acetyl-gamma-glutamyl-phosphate reductase n=1 Tax=unclassified Bradyrhizobium TaxID=2631580 RepID=UPI001BAB6115|nr:MULTISPECIES: N-acetyl-gamma-glutamyl-phosphate reductase [unclassified Bradyrhizobium]MBR1222972.1 N-acetyl-gamma-glutamyl-phosphate reductase [Bradyrhizobium sp. U87765 SZCCT0131]MBR1262708.1 N-acetyl-gamma-glutamyl-phosphate reductase [Bradyrhizobium sp. U87765 SZCCT0134]MBR1308820.1 N-acetyl-gamma-glutamyl-phosphate reductase [Bradyrhizobium sp. U87765 SZCCT0110]MBR1318490.1 N-acetyl-gamma-glutamyl-phosphate reductase [Bradyrhizobium sp. U87765 SZCCT0109]MBR1352194.1 N-acetyl-gamma-glut
MTTSDTTKTPAIFIDGEAGTTGIEIRERLARVAGIAVLSIDPDKRKDPAARKALMEQADLVVLCLPDDAAKEAVALADSLGAQAPRILDASSAHRVADGWTFGFPELAPGQDEAIRTAKRVSNPGCYPTGGIALLRPLVDAGFIPADYPVTVNAVSGYSGGGRTMIEAYEAGNAPLFELYGLNLTHKHLPELQQYSRLTRRPIFVPSVGNFRKGMLVSVPLHLDTLPGKPKADDLEDALTAYYAGSRWVKVIDADDASTKGGRIDALALNDTNLLELRVFGNAAHGQAVLVARLDNLGKGASGAAVQNIGLMLGVSTDAGT